MSLCYRGDGKSYTKEEIQYFQKINSNEVEDLLKSLKSATDKKDCCKLFNRVTSVLVHENWYSEKQMSDILSAAKESKGLTNNQKKFNLPMGHGPPAENCMPEVYNY
jgi:hypothetical protein